MIVFVSYASNFIIFRNSQKTLTSYWLDITHAGDINMVNIKLITNSLI